MADFLSQKELSKIISEKTCLSEEKSKEFVEFFFNSIKDELKKSDSVQISGFGTFKKKWIEESDGINPSTLEKIKIPAHFKISFKPSLPVVRLFNEKYANLKPVLLEKQIPIVIESVPDKIDIIAENEIPKPEDEISKTEDENQEKEPEKKSSAGKIIGITIVVLVVLIILIILLAKSCSSGSSKTQNKNELAANPQKTEQIEQTEPEIAQNKPEIAQTEPEIAQNKPEPPKSDEKSEKEPEPVNPVVTKESSEFTFKDYSVPRGSNYHTIAVEEYGNRHLWPVIFNANKDSSPNPDVVESGAKIKVPQIRSISDDAENIKAAMLEAFSAYKNQISSANSDFENAEKKRLAAGVLTSAEVLYPGFIDANRSKIGDEYADYAKGIFARNY